jgi:hypothetical protein
MLNLSVGLKKEVGGKPHILTGEGLSGHAVFGPYELRDTGLFEVHFEIFLVDEQGCSDDHICAVVDVAADTGKRLIANRGLTLSDIREGPSPVKLKFRLNEPQTLEYRVFCDGSASLLIKAVQRCRAFETESFLQHQSVEVKSLGRNRIPESRNI